MDSVEGKDYLNAPIGLQLVARRYHDEELMKALKIVERILKSWEKSLVGCNLFQKLQECLRYWQGETLQSVRIGTRCEGNERTWAIFSLSSSLIALSSSDREHQAQLHSNRYWFIGREKWKKQNGVQIRNKGNNSQWREHVGALYPRVKNSVDLLGASIVTFSPSSSAPSRCTSFQFHLPAGCPWSQRLVTRQVSHQTLCRHWDRKNGWFGRT